MYSELQVQGLQNQILLPGAVQLPDRFIQGVDEYAEGKIEDPIQTIPRPAIIILQGVTPKDPVV